MSNILRVKVIGKYGIIEYKSLLSIDLDMLDYNLKMLDGYEILASFS